MPAYKRPARKTVAVQSQPSAVHLKPPAKALEPKVQLEPSEALEPTEAVPLEPTQELPPTQVVPALTQQTRLPQGQDRPDVTSTYTVAEEPPWPSQDLSAPPTLPPTQAVPPTQEIPQLGGDRHTQAPQSLEDWVKLGAAVKRRSKGNSSPSPQPSTGAGSAVPSGAAPKERKRKSEATQKRARAEAERQRLEEESNQKREEAEKRARAEAERQRLEEEKRCEEERLRQGEETQRRARAEAERQHLEKEKRREEERKRKSEETQRRARAEAERQRLEEEKRREEELNQKREEADTRAREEAERQHLDEEQRREEERHLQSPSKALANAGLQRGGALLGAGRGGLKRSHSASSGLGFEVPASVAKQIYSRSTRRKSLLDEQGHAHVTSPEPTRTLDLEPSQQLSPVRSVRFVTGLSVSPTQELLPSPEQPQEHRKHRGRHAAGTQNLTPTQDLVPSQELHQKRRKHRSRHSVNLQNLTPTQELPASQELQQKSAAKVFAPEAHISSFVRPSVPLSWKPPVKRTFVDMVRLGLKNRELVQGHVEAEPTVDVDAVTPNKAAAILDDVQTVAESPQRAAQESAQQTAQAEVAVHGAPPQEDAAVVAAKQPSQPDCLACECTPEPTRPSSPDTGASAALNSILRADATGHPKENGVDDALAPPHATQVTGGAMHDGEEVNTVSVRDLSQAFDASAEEEKHVKEAPPSLGGIMDQLGARDCADKTADVATGPLHAIIEGRIAQEAQLVVAAEELARHLAERQEKVAGVYRALGALL